jgi:hypothetical protein
MTSITRLLSVVVLAGLLSVLIGLVDAWAFGGRFGLEWDKALVLVGLAWIAGVQVPAVQAQLRP